MLGSAWLGRGWSVAALACVSIVARRKFEMSRCYNARRAFGRRFPHRICNSLGSSSACTSRPLSRDALHEATDCREPQHKTTRKKSTETARIKRQESAIIAVNVAIERERASDNARQNMFPQHDAQHANR
ncbi:hypothetical protein [Paraburkholderia tropica]|uniref:hypothetical protein n=1 Tax=Paraburkholderia tropica TaxID=92647 RepID=UPI002AB70724|nr:hypothetical protein [Paraburkholderia tropica]